MFHWYDREGNEKILQIQDSLCNQKSNVLRTDHAQIKEKSWLPISKLSYGPHQLETEKMTITVSELVCQQDHLENFETIEDQISETNALITDLKETVEEDDIEIRNLVKIQQDTFEDHINEFNDLQEKVEDQSQKHIESKATIDELSEKANEYEKEHVKIEQLINQQSDLNGTYDSIEGQITTLNLKIDDMQENAGKNHSEVSEQIKANQDLNTAQQSVIQNHVIEINDLKEMVENHDQTHTDSNLSIIDLKEKATGFENERAEFRDLIENQSDTNTAQQEAIENHFSDFDDIKENLEDFGEELAKNQSVIQMKIQAQISNLQPPISHQGSFLFI